jgi:acyl-coenzyme A thioesterase PaaI-like protein
MDDGEYQRNLAAVREKEHARCFVCGKENTRGFGLDVRANGDGSVSAVFDCGAVFRGYPCWLHGGVVTSLLDGAMTNCLFAQGVVAVTAELSVKFQHPVVTGRTAGVRAWVEKCYHPLYIMRAELTQEGRVLATASGKFMIRPEEP